MWFDSWSDLIRVGLVGAAAYAWLVLVLRVSGKRTLAKLNAFDLVVTVALGSTLATVLLNSAVSWSEGAAAFALLAVAQFVVAFVTSRRRGTRNILTSAPTLLVRDGVVLHANLNRQRVAEAEVRQCVRGSGFGGLSEIAAVVLETDGSLSVIPASSVGDGWALADVLGGPHA